tara:strand:- start:614 stop:1396 length:783 start_codon:yes stop_codon:yes gene_type:complete
MDRVVLSTDDNDTYINFFPIVAKAWKKFFDVTVSLAYVTDKPEGHPLVAAMREYGEVHLFPPIEGVPTGNQAKMARFYLASKYSDEVCMVNDIDSAPLSTHYFDRVLSQYEDGKVLAVGAEVYEGTPHAGKFPIGEITATGKVFRYLVNPSNLGFDKYIDSFKNIRVHDHKECILSPEFSDESLLRVLFRRTKTPAVHARRDVDIQSDWVDRSWWGIDEDKLHSGRYVLVNFLRPLMGHLEQTIPIIDYIYGEEKFDDIF